MSEDKFENIEIFECSINNNDNELNTWYDASTDIVDYNKEDSQLFKNIDLINSNIKKNFIEISTQTDIDIKTMFDLINVKEIIEKFIHENRTLINSSNNSHRDNEIDNIYMIISFIDQLQNQVKQIQR